MRLASVLFTSLLCSLLVCLSGCQKEYSTENSGVTSGTGTTGSTAVFTLVPSGNNCSDAASIGAFTAGTQLSGSSYVTVTVNVTKTGTWTFSSAQVNGFALIGSGTFITTGDQEIILLGVGTPTTSGNSTFNLNIGTTLCNVTIPVTTAGSGGNTGSDWAYYKITVDGKEYYQNVTDDNGYEAGSSTSGVDDVEFGANIYPKTSPAPAGSTGFGVTKGIIHHYYNSTDDYFKAYFAPGNYPYAVLDQFGNTGDGILLAWGDPTGEEWVTATSTASDQTGSTFKIISAERTPDAVGRYYLRVKMEFTCKLYNSKTGAVKQVTKGEAACIFGKL